VERGERHTTRNLIQIELINLMWLCSVNDAAMTSGWIVIKHQPSSDFSNLSGAEYTAADDKNVTQVTIWWKRSSPAGREHDLILYLVFFKTLPALYDVFYW